MLLNRNQPNFARHLAVSCTGILYIHFRGFFPPNGILPAAKFTLHPSFVFSYIGSITAQHSSSGTSQSLRHGTRNRFTELWQRPPPIFCSSAIMLGIGRHSRIYYWEHANCTSKLLFKTLHLCTAFWHKCWKHWKYPTSDIYIMDRAYIPLIYIVPTLMICLKDWV